MKKFKFDSNSTENFGRFSLKDPSEFTRMWTRQDSNDAGISYVVGTLADGKYATQTILFNRKIWTEKKASAWWKKNSHRFTLKVRKNPHEPLSWYIETFKVPFELPRKLTTKEKRLPHRYIHAGKFKSGDIYLCYVGNVLYGVIEIYPKTTEYHDFRGKVHQYKNKPNLDSLNNYLYDYFIENI